MCVSARMFACQYTQTSIFFSKCVLKMSRDLAELLDNQQGLGYGAWRCKTPKRKG